MDTLRFVWRALRAQIPMYWQRKWKWNESGFMPPLCTYRLNWARRTSWRWWDDWDDTVLQTQDSTFEPWRSEAEHATSRSRRLPTILTFTRGVGSGLAGVHLNTTGQSRSTSPLVPDLWIAGCWLADGDVTDDRDSWCWICVNAKQNLRGWLWHSLMAQCRGHTSDSVPIGE